MSENYFEAPLNQEDYINTIYNVRQKDVDEMVEMLMRWLEQQPHLPQIQDESVKNIIKFALRCNKMNVEKTKLKLDMFYSIRNIYPEIYADRDLSNPSMLLAIQRPATIPLRIPMDNSTRVFIFSINDSHTPYHINSWTYFENIKLDINMFALQSKFDKCINNAIIINLLRVSRSMASSADMVLLAKSFKMYQKGFSDRMSGIHFLNIPAFILPIIKVVKYLLKEKIATRIHIHDTLESLHEYVPKKILPAEFGGEEISIIAMKEKWNQFMLDNNEWVKKENTYRSNEQLRAGPPLDNEMFGFDGSFRKLEYD